MAVRDQTLVVSGYTDLLRAFAQADKNTKKFLRQTFAEVGKVVRTDASWRFDKFSSRSAAGYRVYVRQRGVGVEQSLRKTTGKRPDYGALQMRDALIPALEGKKNTIEHKFEEAIDKVADHFNHGTNV